MKTNQQQQHNRQADRNKLEKGGEIMEKYKVRRFINDKEVRELTPRQKKMMAVTVIRAIGAKEKKTAR